MNTDFANHQQQFSLNSLLNLLSTIDKGLSDYLNEDVLSDTGSSTLSPIIDYLAKLLSDENELDNDSLNSEDLHPEISKIVPREKIPLKTI